jgi:transcriptional regulator with XRE-family HTH domain
MSTRDWLRGEILSDLDEHGPGIVETEGGQLAELLKAALSETGLSDRSIALLMELEPRASVRQAVTSTEVPLAKDPGIAQRREALGLSTADAARMVGIAAMAYERIERQPLRWRNVRPEVLAPLLARLGVSVAVFLRWLSSMMPAGQQFAWGYRPGSEASGPLSVAPSAEEHEEFVAWGRALLDVPAAPAPDPDVRELFGVRWSESALRDRSRAIAASVQARLLSLPMRGWDGSDERVIRLPSAEGPRYPAFQFDDAGSLRGVVAEVNGLLGASDDPWGVADWWVTKNPHFGVAPVDLVDGDAYDLDRIRAAARSVLEGE